MTPKLDLEVFARLSYFFNLPYFVISYVEPLFAQIGKHYLRIRQQTTKLLIIDMMGSLISCNFCKTAFVVKQTSSEKMITHETFRTVLN